MTFQNLNLPQELLQAIEELGFESPTPIQSSAIPLVLKGSDLKASANTGTGKTAAFLIPALIKAMPRPAKGSSSPRVLVLVPTRELAMQVSNEAVKLSRFLPKIRTVCVYGGVPFFKQKQDLSKKVDILIATPGRLLDHMQRSKLDISGVELFILDEADRMLDMGFCEPVQEIYSAFEKHPQTLMFSATLEGSVGKLAQKLLRNPEEISVASVMTPHNDIEQQIHFADDLSHKIRLLDHLLSSDAIEQVIVFTATKRFAEELVETLRDNGHHAAPLHGDMCQSQRTRTMKRMREGKIKILIATDVAARGLDVHSISHVINFDLPTNAEDYVHRIGRTGRAGAKGIAISLVSGKDCQYIRQIEKFTGQKLTVNTIPGMEPKIKHSLTAPLNNNSKRKHLKPAPFRKNSFSNKRDSDSRFSNKRESDSRFSNKRDSDSRFSNKRDSDSKDGPKRPHAPRKQFAFKKRAV